MSEKPETVDLPHPESKPEPPADPPEKQPEPMPPEKDELDNMAAVEEIRYSDDPVADKVIRMNNGKAPHYRLHPNFSINVVRKLFPKNHPDYRAELAKLRLFTTWAKPKRFGLTVEWAERMVALKQLQRLELTHEL